MSRLYQLHLIRQLVNLLVYNGANRVDYEVMKNHKILLASLFLFTSFTASALQSAGEMPKEFIAKVDDVMKIASEATASRFPDADSVVVADKIHTSYNPDGTETTWDDEWTKALTEKGKRSLSSFTLHFSERYGDAKILAVELIGTNGIVRKVDFEKTTKVVTDNSSMGSNIYDPLDKKLVCTIPGMEVGDIRRVRFCRRTLKPRMKGTWADYNIFEYTLPILSTTLTISQPNSKPVAHAVLRSPCSNTVVRAKDKPYGKDRTLLRWDVRNVPQAFPEPNMPPMHTQVQRLIMSTAKDWETVSRWYWDLCLPRLAASNEAMTNKVNEIVSKEKTRTGKIRALFKFVSQEIRYMGITDEAEAPGYEPHDVKLTFDNRYGVCRDKAALLVEMFRIAGIKAFPVLIHAGAKMDEAVPLPYFNHAIVAVESVGEEIKKHGKYILMDPTNETARDLFPTYLSDKSYLVARPEGEKLLTSPIVSVNDNMYKVKSNGTLSPDGAIILESEMSFGGINDIAYRSAFRRRTDRERREMFQRWLEQISPGVELLSLQILPKELADTETALTAKLTARFPQVILKGETRTELPLPFITKSIGIADMLLDENTALETRRFPLVLDTTAGWEEKLTVDLGEELGKVERILEDVKVGKENGGYNFIRSISITNGVLTATRALYVSDVNFNVPNYLELRENRKRTESGERGNPVFANTKNDNANTKILFTKKIVHFQSPKSWVVTNSYAKEILTYRGMKTSAELKFDYNPCVRNYEIIEAVVSNKNGSVKKATSREINIMDAPWAGTAPRYPASKIMVVNLPGVEIGSTIRVTTVETVTNSPIAFSEFNAFGSTVPVDLEEIEFHVPNKMPFKLKGVAPEIIENANGGKCYRWSIKSPERIPDEPSQPGLMAWRKNYNVSAADWEETGREFITALNEAKAKGSDGVEQVAEKLTEKLNTPEEKIAAIRKFIFEKLKLAGPGISTLPFKQAFFAPDQVLSEGYASAGDRLNVFRTMLEASGFDTSVLMATNDSNEALKKESERREIPRPTSFLSPVIRAVYGNQTFWLHNENEYTPAKASSRFNDTYYNPMTDSFGTVGEKTNHSSWILPWKWFASSDCAYNLEGGKWRSKTCREKRLVVRENGTVDLDVTNRIWGASVGEYRKTYEMMLPENRSRHFQSLLGGISANATATRELETDTKGYPFVLSFSACIPNYAVVKDIEITLRLESFSGNIFSIGKTERKSPIKIPGKKPSVESFDVIFPEGYTELEFTPEVFVLHNPMDKKDIWIEQTVQTNIVDNVLHMKVTREIKETRASSFRPDYAPYFREWNRKASSPAVRTITVRKSVKK